MPVHLRADSSLHPQHRRAVSLLHLRFWIATIALTRPFLLFTVAKMERQAAGMIPVKRRIYERMSNVCVEAAENAVQILRRMREDGTLSSLMLLDCHYIGEVMWILILALQRHGGAERQDMLRFCLETVKGMEKVGWAEKVAPELEARVHESGVLEMPAGNGVLQAAAQPPQHEYSLWQADGLTHQMGGAGQMGVALNAQVSPTTSSDYVGL